MSTKCWQPINQQREPYRKPWTYSRAQIQQDFLTKGDQTIKAKENMPPVLLALPYAVGEAQPSILYTFHVRVDTRLNAPWLLSCCLDAEWLTGACHPYVQRANDWSSHAHYSVRREYWFNLAFPSARSRSHFVPDTISSLTSPPFIYVWR